MRHNRLKTALCTSSRSAVGFDKCGSRACDLAPGCR